MPDCYYDEFCVARHLSTRTKINFPIKGVVGGAPCASHHSESEPQSGCHSLDLLQSL